MTASFPWVGLGGCRGVRPVSHVLEERLRALVATVAGMRADLASQLGHPDADGRGLWERTGGNPLFVREQVLSGQTAVSAAVAPLRSLVTSRFFLLEYRCAASQINARWRA